MITKRIIPCLDIKAGRTVKGTNFVNLIDSGDPLEQCEKYCQEGADELMFLDIAATEEARKTRTALVKKIAKRINIPFSVGGGISSIKDVETLLYSGADKVSINSAAIRSPQLIDDLAKAFGSQCIVVAIDAKSNGAVYISGGKIETEKRLHTWAYEAQERGAGEILYTAIDFDGTKQGFDVENYNPLDQKLSIPVIASGGGGKGEHFAEVLQYAEAALAASIFHFNEVKISDLKENLSAQGIPVRI